MSRTLVAAVLLSMLSVGLAVAYWAGAFERPELTATLAPGASRELKVRGSGSDVEANVEANLEVWGLPETGPDEYYELWFGKEGGRVSAGTFVVDERGRGELSASRPEATSAPLSP